MIIRGDNLNSCIDPNMIEKLLTEMLNYKSNIVDKKTMW